MIKSKKFIKHKHERFGSHNGYSLLSEVDNDKDAILVFALLIDNSWLNDDALELYDKHGERIDLNDQSEKFTNGDLFQSISNDYSIFSYDQEYLPIKEVIKYKDDEKIKLLSRFEYECIVNNTPYFKMYDYLPSHFLGSEFEPPVDRFYTGIKYNSTFFIGDLVAKQSYAQYDENQKQWGDLLLQESRSYTWDSNGNGTKRESYIQFVLSDDTLDSKQYDTSKNYINPVDSIDAGKRKRENIIDEFNQIIKELSQNQQTQSVGQYLEGKFNDWSDDLTKYQRSYDLTIISNIDAEYTVNILARPYWDLEITVPTPIGSISDSIKNFAYMFLQYTLL